MSQSAHHHPALPTPFLAAGVHCGIRRNKERLDLGLLLAPEGLRAAGVFTRSLLRGAHVIVNRESLEKSGGLVRAVLVNSGNANCCTGAQGLADNRRVAAALAEELGCPAEQVLFQSTGVIGALLPTANVLDSLPQLLGEARPEGAEDFVRAIMTTDSEPKQRWANSGGANVFGCAKGSGMIHPNMATMLGYLLTDAALPEDAHALLKSVVDVSFNCTTVDGDTSPNDSVLLWGSGGTGQDPELSAPLTEVARGLARHIAADGEGASRLITIRVEGAPDREAAARVGRSIATSPLVKTAVNGRDPNWGRILAAAARADVAFDTDRARVWIGPGTVYLAGEPRPEEEAAAHRHMHEESEVLIGIDLGAGTASAEIWTCDLSAAYVSINADYRT